MESDWKKACLLDGLWFARRRFLNLLLEGLSLCIFFAGRGTDLGATAESPLRAVGGSTGCDCS